MRHPLCARIAAIATLVLGATALAASAADRVKVVTKTATIRAEASAASKAVAVVAAGTVLDVLGRESGWYRVSVHAGANRAARPGFIEEKAVVPTTERAVLVPLGPGGFVSTGAPASARQDAMRLRAFGEVALQTFTASQSFKAIFDSSVGLFYGGGVEVVFHRNLFANAGVTHFQKTGQRAFAFQGQAFQLGIADRVSITPIMVTVGYRFLNSKRFTPYLGVGGGAVIYRETSDFANAGDNVSKTGSAFQVAGGVELPLARQLSMAVEGQYQGVRGVLGTTGVSQAFNEKDLGGTSIRVKILFGR